MARGRLLAAVAALALGLALSFWLAGLGPRTASPTETQHAGEARYSRIVCMSPAVTEIAFAIGAGGRTVGVSQHTKFPPEALDKPSCGGFFNPNRELILALRPDLIVTQGAAEALTELATAHGIGLIALDLTDLDSIFRETLRLGRALDLESEAEPLCAALRGRLERVRSRAAKGPPIPALLVAGREPGALNGIYAVGPGGFLHELIELAGGRNVFGDLHAPYAVVSKEALLARAPEVIVELHGEGGDPDALERRVREVWGGLRTLPAVRNGRVHAVASTYAQIPGPRVVLMAERLADIFHAEAGR